MYQKCTISMVLYHKGHWLEHTTETELITSVLFPCYYVGTNLEFSFHPEMLSVSMFSKLTLVTSYRCLKETSTSDVIHPSSLTRPQGVTMNVFGGFHMNSSSGEERHAMIPFLSHFLSPLLTNLPSSSFVICLSSSSFTHLSPHEHSLLLILCSILLFTSSPLVSCLPPPLRVASLPPSYAVILLRFLLTHHRTRRDPFRSWWIGLPAEQADKRWGDGSTFRDDGGITKTSTVVQHEGLRAAILHQTAGPWRRGPGLMRPDDRTTASKLHASGCETLVASQQSQVSCRWKNTDDVSHESCLGFRLFKGGFYCVRHCLKSGCTTPWQPRSQIWQWAWAWIRRMNESFMNRFKTEYYNKGLSGKYSNPSSFGDSSVKLKESTASKSRDMKIIPQPNSVNPGWMQYNTI